MPQHPPASGDAKLSPEVPEDSLFTIEEYLEMYKVAASEPAFSILCTLSEEDKLSASKLGMMLDREDNDLHYYLRKLKRSALIRNRRDPNTGTEETYSYYELTDLGHVILTEGMATGIQELVKEEATISKQDGK
ncbi:MarR family transcriptional regulator [Halorubrum sp. CSM-61]|uniref:MarR family transcriptional regulator n=1 Tax=Halorubrum sp. CSM-61 TaxID=2485838 RepID=UPI000F4C8B6D|nr:MarR family transcriptional regulator [Halorubrum sp. CSM-61]